MFTKDDDNADNVKLAKEFKAATDKVKETAEDIKGKMEKGEKLSEKAKETADEALTKFNELKAQYDELEQKLSRRGAEEPVAKSLGRQMVDSEQYKQLKDDPRGVKNAKMSVKATTITNATAGALVEPQVVGGVITPPERKLTIRDLLMPGQTDSSAITYMRETGFTNNAAPQANQGDKKAQSDITFDRKTENVETIAHFIKVAKQILNDASMLASSIDQRLTYGLKLKEEEQLLNGDGLNGNLHGIIPQATAFSNPAAAVTKYTIIDQMRLAMLQAILAEYPASGHVLNPIDWATMELLKDNEGRYIIGQPQGETNPTLWRLPVVETQAIAPTKFLTGAFNMAAQIFDAEDASIEVGFENDDFTRNLLTILCEERLALAVYRPEAFIYGTLQAV